MFTKITMACVLLMLNVGVNAHPGGHGPVDEKQAIYIAVETAKQFIEFDPGLGFGMLGKSWNNITTRDASIFKEGDGYYIIVINNRADNKKLYVLESMEGEVYDANLTGVFEGLN